MLSTPCCVHACSSDGNGSSSRHAGTTNSTGDGDKEDVSKWSAYAAPAALLLGMAALLGGGYAFKGQLRGFIDYFVEVVDTWGPLRCFWCWAPVRMGARHHPVSACKRGVITRLLTTVLACGQAASSTDAADSPTQDDLQLGASWEPARRSVMEFRCYRHLVNTWWVQGS